MDRIISLHAMAIEGTAPDWVHVLPLGTFQGRDGRGPYTVASVAAAEKIIAATLERAAGADLPIDYDHQSDFGAVPGVGGQAPAAGWIKRLEARADGIWAQVEWTVAAADRLRAREYRYLSPVFMSGKDGQVGLVLRASLTNNPNLNLAAVVAAQQGAQAQMSFAKKVAAAMAMPDDSDEEKILEALTKLVEEQAAKDDEAHSDDDKKDTHAQALATIATAVGLPAGRAHTATAIADAIRKDRAAAVPADQVMQLQAQLASLQAGIAEQAAQAAVDAAVKAGKIVPALRDWAVQLHRTDPAAFDTFVAGAPVLVDGGTRLAGPPDATGSGLTHEEKQVCSALGLSEESFLAQRKEIGR